jgi:hypothetical protein
MRERERERENRSGKPSRQSLHSRVLCGNEKSEESVLAVFLLLMEF